jgi:hypothetical protein
MKIAYIAHPISGDIEGNLRKIEAIGRRINLDEPEVVPFAHYFFDCYALNDDIPEERERGIKNDIALMRKGFIDEVRLYGNRISNGMAEEVKLAVELGIEVRPMTKATTKEYEERGEEWGICRVVNWLPFEAPNYEKFTELADKHSLLLKFDDGSVIHQNEKHPLAKVTHFRQA